MPKLKSKVANALLIGILTLSMVRMLRTANASQGGGMQVYIINLDGVGNDATGWVTSRADIVSGALNACQINGK
jgi:hypothetical protein